MHLVELCTFVKNQRKEQIIFWFNQKDKFKNCQTYNPADLLGKFDVTNDKPQRWYKLTQDLISPEWLNETEMTSVYLPKLLKKVGRCY